MRKKYLRQFSASLMSIMLATAMISGCGKVQESSGGTAALSENADSTDNADQAQGGNASADSADQTKEQTTEEADTDKAPADGAAEADVDAAGGEKAPEQHDDYELVWADEFDGDSLNTSDWNVETHEPGWVNAELQRYTALDEGNIEVSDGTLKIIPHIETEDSEEKITSGRITTQNKHDFTYGRFEARAKVPTGKGYLPAFWLMATDEGLYGQWPKCGEIDIMEVMGQDTGKSYHTIHYGYSSGNGHKENQGIREIEANGYSDDFHVFRMDWEPGKISWYVDDEFVYSTDDWYTGTDDDNQITYPAPFDQNFYVILNLAVGGNWVGYPGDAEKAEMNDKAFEVDYVRVYQRPSDEYEKEESTAKRPEGEPVTFREPDAEGNYVNNSTFTEDIGRDKSEKADDDNWKYHLESDVFGTTYELSEEGITLIPAKTSGGVFYAIQLKQENIPMYRGWEYELTFDAYSTEEREIIIDVEGPDRGWIRYFEDTPLTIGTEKKTYTYTFTMNENTDANGSLEFNLGKQPSIAPVTINNVKLVHKSGEEMADGGDKSIRPDGNFVYNGTFDQGESRLGYWEINDADKESIAVTNKNNVRELKVTVPSGGKEIIVRQSDLSPIVKGEYELSFNARCEDAASSDGLTVQIAGKDYTPALETSDKKFSEKISFDKDNSREESCAEIIFTKEGTYYIDNLFFSEAALIKNGSFNAGLAGFTPYVYDTVTASYVVDSMNGNENAFAITIDDTMANEAENSWYIQLNQDGITLEEGKSYELTFKAKSSIDRTIAYSLQQYEGDWTNYSGTTEPVAIGKDWKTITAKFKMEYPTDRNARFNITMGSVDGVRVTDKHDIFIDDISLIELQ